MRAKGAGEGTKAKPWKLKTPSGSSEYEMYRAEDADPPAIVCVVGKTELRYQLRAIEDLHAMLKKHGDWMLLGSADEQKPAAEGTVEAWGRSPKNPVKGWYGLKKGLRGRSGMYMPPLLEALGLAEVEHNPEEQSDPRSLGSWGPRAAALAPAPATLARTLAGLGHGCRALLPGHFVVAVAPDAFGVCRNRTERNAEVLRSQNLSRSVDHPDDDRLLRDVDALCCRAA